MAVRRDITVDLTIFSDCCRNVEFRTFWHSQRQKTEPTHTDSSHRQPCTRVRFIDGNSTSHRQSCTSRPFQHVSCNTSDACWTSAISKFDYTNVENRNVQGSFSNEFILPFNLIYQIVYPPTHPLLRCTISRLALSHNMGKSCGLLSFNIVTFRRHERQNFILLVSGSTQLFVLQTRGSMAT